MESQICAGVSRAVAEACGEVYASLAQHGRGAVRRSAKPDSPDYICTAPAAIFRRLQLSVPRKLQQHQQHQQEQEQEQEEEEEVREDARHLPLSPQLLAERIVSCFDDDLRAVCAFVSTTEDGSILICSTLYMIHQNAFNKLHCTLCGTFVNGDKGLRDHHLIKDKSFLSLTSARHFISHGCTYEASKNAVAQSHMQVAIYHGATEGLRQHWQDQALQQQRARDTLDEGLIAARDGNLVQLKELIAQGWDALQTADRHGSNALCWAAGSGHLDTCRYLVEDCGVNPHLLLGAPKKRRAAIHWAARNGHIDVVEWLVVAQQVDVDTLTDDGTTAFHFAVWQSHYGMCCWLVREGKCNVHALNSFGCNAIQWAAQKGHIFMAEYLRDLKLDLRLLNNNGHSALHKAAVKGQTEMCRWLIEEGGLGKRHAQADNGGYTPADMAQLEGFTELGDWLTSVKYPDE